MSLRYVQSKQIVESRIADEVVMLDMDSGYYFGLNSVASDIWIKLKHPASIEEIVLTLLSQYEVDQDTCLTETTEIVQQMLDHGLVHVAK